MGRIFAQKSAPADFVNKKKQITTIRAKYKMK